MFNKKMKKKCDSYENDVIFQFDSVYGFILKRNFKHTVIGDNKSLIFKFLFYVFRNMWIALNSLKARQNPINWCFVVGPKFFVRYSIER